MLPQTGSAALGPAVAYFAKAPRPGLVKTRLCPPLRPSEAAGLYAAFLSDTAVPVPGARGFVFGWPADDLGAIRDCVHGDLELCPQQGDDLFARVEDCFARLFARGHGPVVVRNTDSPDLPAARVAEAMARAKPGRVVLGPDPGGGYYLIALAEPVPGLLSGLGEGDATVFDRTAARARALGLEVVTLAVERDVDTYDDLIALFATRLRASGRA